jgi:uncharacterized protein
MAGTIPAEQAIRQLCLRCGLCCNGVLFRDVELQPGDKLPSEFALSAFRFPSWPEPPHPARYPRMAPPSRLPQPCAALGPDCRCRFYANRPSRCKAFECALFKQVLATRRAIPDALRVIRAGLDRAERVRSLLRRLGETQETLALSLRFQRLRKTINPRSLTDETAAVYAELTLAVHDLNLLLGREFHP